MYEQIISVVGLDRDLVYGNYGKLDKVLAIFYETLRMFPSGHVIIREAHEDTMLQISNPNGRGITNVPIQKGMQVVVDQIGIHYNPRYFDSPNEYRLSRWYGVSSDRSQAFTAFSIGPCECIGRKFATTEASCFLALLHRDFTIYPIIRVGETKESWRNNMI